MFCIKGFFSHKYTPLWMRNMPQKRDSAPNSAPSRSRLTFTAKSKSPETVTFQGFAFGTPGAIRTHDLQSRSFPQDFLYLFVAF